MKGNFNPEHFATMTTTDVSTLISDSGVVRYKIESPLWLVFDQAKEPRWDFPKGIHLEKYNDMFRVEAEVRCDSARYFQNMAARRICRDHEYRGREIPHAPAFLGPAAAEALFRFFYSHRASGTRHRRLWLQFQRAPDPV